MASSSLAFIQSNQAAADFSEAKRKALWLWFDGWDIPVNEALTPTCPPSAIEHLEALPVLNLEDVVKASVLLEVGGQKLSAAALGRLCRDTLECLRRKGIDSLEELPELSALR